MWYNITEDPLKLVPIYNCSCGGYFRYNNKSRHLKTKIHIKYIHNQAAGN